MSLRILVDFLMITLILFVYVNIYCWTCRLTVDNFWSDEKRLPSSTKDRLIALLKNLYSPSTEESFLQYTTFLLLERTSNSPDYKRKIFEHPLTQCNFQVLIGLDFFFFFLIFNFLYNFYSIYWACSCNLI